MNLDNVKNNIRKLVILCEQRNIPFNYSPIVDPYYLVIYPGGHNQFLCHRYTYFSAIPSEVFADIKHEQSESERSGFDNGSQ